MFILVCACSVTNLTLTACKVVEDSGASFTFGYHRSAQHMFCCFVRFIPKPDGLQFDRVFSSLNYIGRHAHVSTFSSSRAAFFSQPGASVACLSA